MKLGTDSPSRFAPQALLVLIALLLFGAGLIAGGYRPIADHTCPSGCPRLELDVLASECQAARCAADHHDADREVNAAAFSNGVQNEPSPMNVVRANTSIVNEDRTSPARLLNGQKQTAHPPRVWPKVLSVFTSRNPDKPDKLAGSSSAWPLPPGPVTMDNMVPRGTFSTKVPSDWNNRRVRPDDFGIALRGVQRYTRAEVCQVIDGAKCCATGPTITTGPFMALCRDPADCSSGRGCKRQVGDITRPGDESVYYRTTQIAVDGPCQHRGAVDVTPAFQDACGFVPMRPVTVRLIQ